MYTKSEQQGFVSIFSVIFFALLSSVITVGFTRIMLMEQQQALDNDLTARALSAAEGGVEDAKRAILYYSQLPEGTVKTDLRRALNSEDCDALKTATQGIADLPRFDGVISDSGHQDMQYRCLTVGLDTPDYQNNIELDETVTVPLTTGGTLKGFDFQWHFASSVANSETDGPSTTLRADRLLPTKANFPNTGTPAFVRLQLVGVPKSGSFDRAALEDRSRTIFLVPGSPAGGGTSSTDFDSSDSSRGFYGAKENLISVLCGITSTTGEYACKVTLGMPSTGALDTANNNYYLRVTSLYRSTHIRISGLTDGTVPLQFQDVQPVIDSTGVAADVFRRIQVRTNFPGINFDAPRYGLDSGQTICKDFTVTELEYLPSGNCVVE